MDPQRAADGCQSIGPQHDPDAQCRSRYRSRGPLGIHRRQTLSSIAGLIVLGTWIAVDAEVAGDRPRIDCPTPRLAQLVSPPPPTATPPDQPYERLRPTDTRLNLGIGHLRPDGEHFGEWINHIEIPLFHDPDDPPFAWLQRGWVVDADSRTRQPLGTRGMVETGYETPSFIVLTTRDDGWVQLRYHPGDGDIAWTHTCFFDRDSASMAVELWPARFLGGEISPLYFRTAVRHALRRAPDAMSPRLSWIPADPSRYAIQPLEVRGEWMRVHVIQPSDYCSGPDGPPTDTTTGWIKWRDDEIGSWLWYYTRGC